MTDIESADDRVSTVNTQSQSYGALVWRRFRRSFPGMMGLVLVSLLLLSAIFAEFVAPMDPNQPDVSFAPPDKIDFTPWPTVYAIVETDELDPITYQPLMGPDLENPRPLAFFVKGEPYHLMGLIPMQTRLVGLSDGQPLHLLGTDKLGRDILSRGIYGARLTLMISLVSITLITIIGTLMGITSGYIGGRFDMWFQRFVEIVLAFPQLPLYLTLTTLIPPTSPSPVFLSFVILVIVGLGWAQLSREVRSKTMSMARIDYVRAAVAVGASDGRIITRHILPNVLSHVIVSVTLGIPTIILLESFLGFLGFAVKPPLISWGLMLQDAQTFSSIGSYPWILSPVGFVLLAVFAFNALGDGLRDAVDPY
ncbi:ABC transporter permease [Stagnihabitans tardus]|uniref:ABC transporter permease subunit n=1 Tax=Stagnihabitans tardus TaxID=2699202 RepID=A0AAE4Y9G3_9RHOB|nr:ABC transporter permease [Stagnihabitans tardus]NBZ87729.1 ABC transporter permease subunit [Stagnihabitans tardus]